MYSFQQRYQILLDFAVYSIVNVDPFSKVFSQQWFAMTPVTFIVSKTSIPEFPGYVKNNCLFHHTIAPSDVYLMKPLDQRVIWSLLKIVSVAGHVKTILIRIKSWKIVTKLKNRSASNAIIAALIICFFLWQSVNWYYLSKKLNSVFIPRDSFNIFNQVIASASQWLPIDER